jgi:hypothetical protein
MLTIDTDVERVSQRSSGFLPQGMLTGCAGISPLNHRSSVAVLRDQTCMSHKVAAPLDLVSLRLAQVELHPSQFSLALSCK